MRNGLSLKLLRKLHQTIAKITLDFEGAGTSIRAWPPSWSW
jgi:hypothetical protein